MKQCPKCKQHYSDSDSYCNTDGSNLLSFQKDRKKILIASAAALVFLIFFVLNAFPYLFKRASSNCKVSLVGISVKDNVSGKKAREIFEDIFGKDKKIPDLTKADVFLIIAIENNNLFSFTVNSIDIKLFANSKQFASGNLSEKQKIDIGAWKKTEFRLPLNFSLLGLGTVFEKILTSEEIRCNADGEVILDTFLGIVKYPIKMEGINLPIQ